MNNESGYERSGASHRVKSKRRGASNAQGDFQPTAATSYYAGQGDAQSSELVRSMYAPAPTPYSKTLPPPEAFNAK